MDRDEAMTEDEVDDRGPELDALYTAWTIIANAHEGDWSKATPEWRAAAERWRDEMFHPLLDAAGGKSEKTITPERKAEVMRRAAQRELWN